MAYLDFSNKRYSKSDLENLRAMLVKLNPSTLMPEEAGSITIDQFQEWLEEAVQSYTSENRDILKGDTGATGATGATGKGIKKIDSFYATTTEENMPPLSEITSPSIPEMSPINKYLWKKDVITYTDDSVGTPVIALSSVYGDTGAIGPAGERGATGAQGPAGADGQNGVSSYLHVKYAETVIPDLEYLQPLDDDMQDAPATYMGTYVDYNIVDSAIAADYKWIKVVGDPGPAGPSGAGGQYVEFNYALHSSATVAPTGGWTETPSALTDAQPYLWLKSRVIEGDGTVGDWSTPALVGTNISKVLDMTTQHETLITQHTAEIAANATAIATKVSQSAIDNVNERVSTAESTVAQYGAEIAQKVSTSSYEADKKTTVTSTINQTSGNIELQVAKDTSGSKSAVGGISLGIVDDKVVAILDLDQVSIKGKLDAGSIDTTSLKAVQGFFKDIEVTGDSKFYGDLQIKDSGGSVDLITTQKAGRTGANVTTSLGSTAFFSLGDMANSESLEKWTTAANTKVSFSPAKTFTGTERTKSSAEAWTFDSALRINKTTEDKTLEGSQTYTLPYRSEIANPVNLSVAAGTYEAGTTISLSKKTWGYDDLVNSFPWKQSIERSVGTLNYDGTAYNYYCLVEDTSRRIQTRFETHLNEKIRSTGSVTTTLSAKAACTVEWTLYVDSGTITSCNIKKVNTSNAVWSASNLTTRQDPYEYSITLEAGEYLFTASGTWNGEYIGMIKQTPAQIGAVTPGLYLNAAPISADQDWGGGTWVKVEYSSPHRLISVQGGYSVDTQQLIRGTFSVAPAFTTDTIVLMNGNTTVKAFNASNTEWYTSSLDLGTISSTQAQVRKGYKINSFTTAAGTSTKFVSGSTASWTKVYPTAESFSGTLVSASWTPPSTIIARNSAGATGRINPNDLFSAASVNFTEYAQSKGITVQNINPVSHNAYDIGASTNAFQNMYATTFHGALDGNATSANTAGTAGSAQFATKTDGVRDYNTPSNVTKFGYNTSEMGWGTAWMAGWDASVSGENRLRAISRNAFVMKRVNGYCYSNVASLYWSNSSGALRINFGGMCDCWAMFGIVLTLRPSYNPESLGEAYIMVHTNGTDAFSGSAALTGYMSVGSLYTVGKDDLYLAGMGTYGTACITTMLCGDAITSKDLSQKITLSLVSAVPTGATYLQTKDLTVGSSVYKAKFN